MSEGVFAVSCVYAPTTVSHFSFFFFYINFWPVVVIRTVLIQLLKVVVYG